jgi:hypothetical protein
MPTHIALDFFHSRDTFHENLEGLSLLIRVNETPGIDDAILDRKAYE